MSQFSFFSNIDKLVRADDSLSVGPIPRYNKRKALETSDLNSPRNRRSISINSSFSLNKMPKNINEISSYKSTPLKTPKKSPSSNTKTPCGADRFISNRSALNLEFAQYKMTQENFSIKNPKEFDIITGSMTGVDLVGTRILEHHKKAPAPPEGYQNSLKVIYSAAKTSMSSKSTSRYIPQAPERILDAPDIIDDYYLNLIDWNANNLLAVSLNNSIYLWNAETRNIDHLLELEGADYVCSVNWLPGGNLLAVGTSLGDVQLWDVAQMKRLRIMNAHPVRVSSLSWNTHIISSGSRSGEIIHHDVRQQDHVVATLSSHTHEVCGLKWSPDGQYLASGGNDNLLNIWSGIPGQATFQNQPVYSLSAHQAAVKALAWCPWQSNLLASGGGTADRHIRFWNCNNGSCSKNIDTKSQVCSLVWSSTFKEIVSGHGFANNQLIIWKYPTLTKVAELSGHTARVLHLALSPDGTTILSAGADETLRMWRCFVPDRKKELSSKLVNHNVLKPHIR